MQLPPDLVIFDCDGVLVDSEPITNLVIRDNLARHGLDLPLNEIIELFVGGTMMGVMTTSRDMGATLPDGWLDEVYSEIFVALEEHVSVIPGVPELLDSLDRAGIPYAVGSNGPHAKMDITLHRTGLTDRLNGRVVSREDVARPKPAPDVYLTAAKLAGVSPARCVVVEDSPSGARAGKAAGMMTLGFVAEADPARLRPICDGVFGNMSDLPALLGL